MANKPTPKEVKAEIAALKEMKPKVRRFTLFGGDNHAAIDAQLSVLEDELTEDEVYELRDSGEFTEHQVEHALEAIEYLDGYCEEGLSGDWKTLVRE